MLLRAGAFFAFEGGGVVEVALGVLCFGGVLGHFEDCGGDGLDGGLFGVGPCLWGFGCGV